MLKLHDSKFFSLSFYILGYILCPSKLYCRHLVINNTAFFFKIKGNISFRASKLTFQSLGTGHTEAKQLRLFSQGMGILLYSSILFYNDILFLVHSCRFSFSFLSFSFVLFFSFDVAHIMFRKNEGGLEPHIFPTFLLFQTDDQQNFFF